MEEKRTKRSSHPPDECTNFLNTGQLVYDFVSERKTAIHGEHDHFEAKKVRRNKLDVKFVRKLRCLVYRLRLYIRAQRVNSKLLIATVLFIARRSFDLRARTHARDTSRVKRCLRYRVLLVSSLGKIRFSTFVERLGRRDRKLFRQSRSVATKFPVIPVSELSLLSKGCEFPSMRRLRGGKDASRMTKTT